MLDVCTIVLFAQNTIERLQILSPPSKRTLKVIKFGTFLLFKIFCEIFMGISCPLSCLLVGVLEDFFNFSKLVLSQNGVLS
jgi:hypothetical protein